MHTEEEVVHNHLRWILPRLARPLEAAAMLFFSRQDMQVLYAYQIATKYPRSATLPYD